MDKECNSMIEKAQTVVLQRTFEFHFVFKSRRIWVETREKKLEKERNKKTAGGLRGVVVPRQCGVLNPLKARDRPLQIVFEFSYPTENQPKPPLNWTNHRAEIFLKSTQKHCTFASFTSYGCGVAHRPWDSNETLNVLWFLLLFLCSVTGRLKNTPNTSNPS